MEAIERIATNIVDASVGIHRGLGPGLLESVYEIVLAGELERRGHKVDRQKPVDIHYDGLSCPAAFRLDLLVDDSVIVEIKSVERLAAVHAKQMLTYLRLSDKRLGLLLNFSGETMKEGIRRLANDYRPRS
jgi:iron complex transport system substrate-binding protein